MTRYNNVLEAIGKTPLIKLNKVVGDLPVEMYAKFEAMNPGGSIKDRIALSMIESAEREGKLKPGSTIVEATAGNTGIGLAMIAAVKGYRCIFAVPNKMSEEKVVLLKAFGAEVVRTRDDVPPDSPESYNGVADRIAAETPGSFRAGQFFNPANPMAHYLMTGPEIWQDTEGRVDVLVGGVGTGGTISGTGRYLKEKKPGVKVVLADPEGSILSGDKPRGYLVEGIGEDFFPDTYDMNIVDDWERISDKESFTVARRLASKEGLLVGSSSGTATAAALRYAKKLQPGAVVVVVLPDTGRNNASKLFDDTWLKEHYLTQ